MRMVIANKAKDNVSVGDLCNTVKTPYLKNFLKKLFFTKGLEYFKNVFAKLL